MGAGELPREGPGAAGETYTVRGHYGEKSMMTRGMIRSILDASVPLGPTGVSDCLFRVTLREDDFMAACRHFGLEHLLVDVTRGEVLDELEARRARGAPPTNREPPMLLEEGKVARELADAMLDVYERKVAEAEASLGGRRAAA